MNYRVMFTLNTVVTAVLGALFLVAPKFFLLFFGVSDVTVAAQVVARFLGGALIVSAALLWFLKDSGKDMQKNLAYTMLAASVVGFILTLMGMVSDKVIRANGWILLVIYLLFAAGYAYLAFGVSVTVKKKK